jgi:hypothetical protein
VPIAFKATIPALFCRDPRLLIEDYEICSDESAIDAERLLPTDFR